jgi:hypothetical protein
MPEFVFQHAEAIDGGGRKVLVWRELAGFRLHTATRQSKRTPYR